MPIGRIIIPSEGSPPGVFYPAPNPNGSIGDVPSMVLPDDLDTEIRQVFYVPLAYRRLLTAQIILVSAATGNLYRSVTTDFGKLCSDEAYNTHSDSITADIVAVTADELECLDVSDALTGIAAGDLIGVTFTREGTDVLDTVGANVHYLGIRLRYRW